MKKAITSIFVLCIFLFANSISANNGFLGDKTVLKKHSLKKSGFLNSSNRFAEESKAFGEGKLALSLGYGAFSGGILKVLLKNYEDEAGYNFTSLGPIHFRGEYGLSDKVGLALSVNHNSWQANWTHMDSTLTNVYQDEFKRSVTSILARLNFHFSVSDKVDPYWGIGAGYRLVDYSFTSTDAGYDVSVSSPFVMGFETTLGIRYYIMEGFGLYGEIGLAQSFVQGGIAVIF